MGSVNVSLILSTHCEVGFVSCSCVAPVDHYLSIPESRYRLLPSKVNISSYIQRNIILKSCISVEDVLAYKILGSLNSFCFGSFNSNQARKKSPVLGQIGIIATISGY